jgi:predicted RecA/RadA family phage recombinase
MIMALGGTNFKLRSSTNNDPFAVLEFTAATGYTAGQMMKLEDTVGVVAETVTSGHQVVLVYEAAKIIVPCAVVTSGNLAEYAVGCKVYFDAADAEVNTDASGNTLCGIVLVEPAVGDEEVEIHLMGALGIVT